MERIKLNIQKFAKSSSKNSVEVEFTASAKELSKELQKVRGELGKLAISALEVGKALNSWNISGITNKIKSLGNSLYKNFLSKAIDTTEELNLFNVVFNNIEKDGVKTFSKLGKQATRFQNDLNEAFGTNKKETMRYQGLFQAMGESAGLDDEIANKMSENMTKLAYDLASLYNTTETKAAESLRAGVYAG